MSASLALSLEFIALLHWLEKHKKKELSLLVREAVAAGAVQPEALFDDNESPDLSLYVDETMTRFVELLENLVESTVASSKTTGGILQQRLRASIEHLDRATIDSHTVLRSLHQAQTLLLDRQETSPDVVRKVVFQRLLANWNVQAQEEKKR